MNLKNAPIDNKSMNYKKKQFNICFTVKSIFPFDEE